MTRLSIHPISRSRYLLAAIFISFLGLLAILVASHVQAADPASSNERLITIHDRGKDKGILTEATTLQQAFDEAGIVVDKNDLVEPGLDETLVANSYQVNIYRARPVIIIDGASTQKVLSPYQTSKQIVQHAGLELHDEDVTTVEPIVDVVSHGAGLQVRIDRATAFTLVLYGKKTTAYTQAETVGEMMKKKGITLGQNDEVSLSENAPISENMSVEIWRNGKQTITEELDIEFPVEKIQDADRALGYREVKTVGEKGKRTVTYEIVIKNGIEESRKEILSMTILEPKKQVETIGAKLPTPTNPSEAQALGRQMMVSAGFSDSEWPCLYNLWMRESGWRTTAGNTSSGAYGIPQSLPASKMGSHGADYLTSASTQISWGLSYIKGRYSTPCGAWGAFQSKGWY